MRQPDPARPADVDPAPSADTPPVAAGPEAEWPTVSFRAMVRRDADALVAERRAALARRAA